MKSTILRHATRWLTPATGCLLVFIGLSQSQVIAAEKLGTKQIQVRRTVPVEEHVRVVPMGCDECRDVVKEVPDFHAKGGQIQRAGGRPTRLVARHECGGCATSMRLVGHGKSRMRVFEHTCTALGERQVQCCITTATAGKSHTRLHKRS